MKKIIYLLFLLTFISSSKAKDFSDQDLRELFIITDPLSAKFQYGGAVLFTGVFQNNLSCSIKKKMPNTFLFTDEEGGTVSRLNNDSLPSANMAQKNSSNYFNLLTNTAKELKTNCVDVNLAPFLEPYEDYSRSFSKNTILIHEYSEKFISTMHQSQILTVAKHFPNAGISIQCEQINNLTNLNLKIKKNSEATQCKILDESQYKKNLDLYKTTSADAIMIGSNIYTNISPFPAFIEPKYREIIQQQQHINKLLISDALWEIEATPETIIRALKTVDWVMVGYAQSVEDVIPYIKKAIKTGDLKNDLIQEKLDKIKEFKFKKNTLIN